MRHFRYFMDEALKHKAWDWIPVSKVVLIMAAIVAAAGCWLVWG